MQTAAKDHPDDQPSGWYQAGYVGPDDRLYKAPETFAAGIDAEGWLTDRRRKSLLCQSTLR
ncbi:hypothetical protein [Mycobacterium sp. 852002-40037_SCH5390672]|uniref:hypothetical protein n=1 Tax=Mycobacterium sp. 852002-40037_SCH5390672 TaxID=1834089 RepID=UPI000805F72E|nr:hypothetical protein A5782_16505 [Mycobacterium sp. 852002-40037_SCH5390672]